MNSDIFGPVQGWPYLDTLVRLLLAVGLGLIVGMEREKRGKEAGARTFAFVAIAGCLGGMLGDAYAVVALLLVIPFLVFLNVDTFRKGEAPELTTSACLVVISMVGVLCGKGHTFVPVVVTIGVAGLLAWKRPIEGFSVGISESEIRTVIMLGVLAFVIYPVLPTEPIDPWNLIHPRTVWITVILVPGIAFGNYVLLRIFGPKGATISDFLAGLVNSIVAVIDVSLRAAEDRSKCGAAYRGSLLATSAMFLRNGVLVGLFEPKCLFSGGLPLALMFAASFGLAYYRLPAETEAAPLHTKEAEVYSPISLKQGLRFGVLFLVVTVLGTLAQRQLGTNAFYAVSAIGGLFSSSSAAASAGQLAAHNQVSLVAGGIASVIASLASAIMVIPLVARYGKDKLLTRRVTVAIAVVTLVGALSTLAGPVTDRWINDAIQRPVPTATDSTTL